MAIALPVVMGEFGTALGACKGLHQTSRATCTCCYWPMGLCTSGTGSTWPNMALTPLWLRAGYSAQLLNR